MDELALYEERIRLRTSDFDCFDRLTPSAVLDLVQEVAGKHADLMNIGYKDLIKHNRTWVLLSTRVKFLKNPSLSSELVVSTWPRKKSLAHFDRDSMILDYNGDVIAKIHQKWVIIDYKERRIVLPRYFDYPLKEMCEKKAFDDELKKLEDFSIEGLDCYDIKVLQSDLDHNGHVNNVKYIQYITNIIKFDKSTVITDLQIDYIHELKADEIIKIYIKNVNKMIYAKALKDNNLVFICRIQYKILNN